MSQANQFPDQICKVAATIANAGTLSAALDLVGTSATGLLIPAGFSTSTSITFRVAADPADTPVALNNALGSRYSVPITGGVAVPLDPTIFAGWRVVQLEVGAAVSGDAAFVIVTRPI